MSLSKNEKSVFFRDIKEKDITDLFEFLNELDNNTKRFFHPHSFDIETITDICKSKKDHYFVMFLDNTLIGYSFLRLFGYEIPSFGCCIRKGYEHKGYGYESWLDDDKSKAADRERDYKFFEDWQFLRFIRPDDRAILAGRRSSENKMFAGFKDFL